MSEEIKPAVTDPTRVVPPANTDNKDVITLTKSEHEALIAKGAEVETARNLQAQADKKSARLEKLLNRGGVHSFAKNTTTPPADNGAGNLTRDELDEKGIVEDRKAEKGLVAIAMNPKYREIFDADSTLRNLLSTNPLGVLPVLAPDALDAEDALELVTEKLDALLAKSKPPVVTPPVVTPPTPPVGAANPSNVELDSKYEEAKKIPNTENALASMIKVGMSKMKMGGK